MRRGKWIIFGMLVALLAGCSGKKTAETSADAKNAESTDEKNTLDFVDAHGEHYTVEINEAVAKNPYDKALFVKNENKMSYEDKKYRFSMWQYSSTGSVPGIEGNVDLNIQLLKK